jgi:hypothetical protein
MLASSHLGKVFTGLLTRLCSPSARTDQALGSAELAVGVVEPAVDVQPLMPAVSVAVVAEEQLVEVVLRVELALGQGHEIGEASWMIESVGKWIRDGCWVECLVGDV